MDYDIKNPALAEEGARRIEWADRHMPVLAQIRDRFEATRPLAGVRVGACLHVTTETANLVRTLRAGGAEVFVCASNPLSTQDDVAAALVVEHEVSTFAIRGEDGETYYRHANAVLDAAPDIVLDDGADLTHALHTSRASQPVLGGAEETTTGVIRLRALAAEGGLRYPIVAVNDASTKHLFDNRYGTGQSTWDGIIRATNVLLAGTPVVVAGYGYCGRGIASRARGLGANVIVTEVDPLRALEAVMDGFRVLPMLEAAREGEIVVTATGDKAVVREEHFAEMVDNTILANSGHFDVEIDLKALAAMAVEQRDVRQNLREYRLADGRRILVVAEGRLVNLGAAEGHPAAVMDMSFANQALVTEYLAREGRNLAREVYSVPKSIDDEIARLKLAAMRIGIDTLTPEQHAYLTSWSEGT